MEERGNKTIICSVFFLDIVEYSKKSVSGQISLKERFNAFLSTAIRDVPINDRIILDTGDGAAISFLGDVEDALRAALSMRSSLLEEDGLVDPALLVRMGVNLGPVRLVKDINGQPNIVGDGINVAQRIMGFAEPGQILVSRSYYDAASRLSQEYAGMFHYEGARTDKHVREHEVYAIGYPGDLTASHRANDSNSNTKVSKALVDVRIKLKNMRTAVLTQHNQLSAYLRGIFERASGVQRALYVSLMAIPVLLAGLLVIKLAHKDEVVNTSAQKMELAVSSVASASAKSSVAPATSASNVAAVSAPHPVESSKKSEPVREKSDKKEKKEKKSEHKKHKIENENKIEVVAIQPEPRPVKTVQPSNASGVVSFAVRPWGEVYLDGKMEGVSPPLAKIQVAPGEHSIEIRNSTFSPYKQSINIKAGEKLIINHKFAN